MLLNESKSGNFAALAVFKLLAILKITGKKAYKIERLMLMSHLLLADLACPKEFTTKKSSFQIEKPKTEHKDG